MSTGWQRSLAVLLVTTIFLPFLVSYLHFQSLLRQHDVLIVSTLSFGKDKKQPQDDGARSDSVLDVSGIYRLRPALIPPTVQYERIMAGGTLSSSLSRHHHHWSWPVAATMGSAVFWQPDTARGTDQTLLRYGIVGFEDGTSSWAWCFVAANVNERFCQKVNDANNDKRDETPPLSSGTWSRVNDDLGAGRGKATEPSHIERKELVLEKPHQWFWQRSNSNQVSSNDTSGSTSSSTTTSTSSTTSTTTNDNNKKNSGTLLYRRNPNKHKTSIWQRLQHSPLIQFLSYKPATALLLTLNVYLAFLYWRYQVPPSAVAKHYRRIVDHGELWRGLTGATAHFQPLHLGFNGMALYSLGHELEGRRSNGSSSLYGNLEFLLWNLSLIVLTTVVMMALFKGRIMYLQRRQRRDNGTTMANPDAAISVIRETSSVGYSGVLFAWMVVASLEQSRTCPIPMLPNTCFETYQIGPIRFSLGPWVQLLVAQFLIPHVSFVGHLAGLLVGYFLHWRVLPPLEVSQPCVLVPLVMLLYHGWHKTIVLSLPDRNVLLLSGDTCLWGSLCNSCGPRRDTNNDNTGDNQDEVLGLVGMPSSSGVRSSSLSLSTMSLSSFSLDCLRFGYWGCLLHTGLALLGVIQGSQSLYWLPSALVNTILLSVVLATVASRPHRPSDAQQERCATVIRAAIVCVVLSIITDATTLGGWVALWCGGQGVPNRSLRLIWWVLWLLIQSWIVLSLTSVLTCLVETIQDDGIFGQVLGRTVLRPCSAIMEKLRNRTTAIRQQRRSRRQQKPLPRSSQRPNEENEGNNSSSSSSSSNGDERRVVSNWV